MLGDSREGSSFATCLLTREAKDRLGSASKGPTTLKFAENLRTSFYSVHASFEEFSSGALKGSSNKW